MKYLSPIVAVVLSVVWSSTCAVLCPILSEALRLPDANILLALTAVWALGHVALWWIVSPSFPHLFGQKIAEKAKTISLPVAFASSFGGLVLFSETDPGGKVSAVTLIGFLAFVWAIHALGVSGLMKISPLEQWSAFMGMFAYAVFLGTITADGFELLAAVAAMLLVYGPILGRWSFRAALTGKGEE